MIITIGKHIIDFSEIGFLELFLPIYSVLMYYTLPVVGSVGQIILLIYMVIYFITHRNIQYHIPKYLLLFTIIVIPIQLVVFQCVGGFTFSRVINLSMIIVYLVILSYFQVNVDGLFKIYKLFAIFASITILIQFVQIHFFNQIVHQIMLFPMERPMGWYNEGLRPQGVFPEPQVFATFMLPILVLVLRKSEYISAIFFTIAIFASTSSLGILCAAAVWGYHVFFSEISITKKIALILLIAIGTITLTQTSLFEYGINKITSTNFTNNVRLTRGFTIYSKLPIINKLFGIGVNNLAYYQESGQIILNDYMSIAMRNPSYVTTMSDLLIGFGLFATLLYLLFLFNLFWNSDCRLLVILLFVLSFAQTILFSGVWYLYMVVIFATLKEENDCFLLVRGKILDYE